MSSKKRIYYRTERELEGLQYIAKVIDFGVSLAIASAFNEMSNAQLLLSKTPIHKQALKRALRLAIKKSEVRFGLIKNSMADVRFFEEYADAVIDCDNNDIVLLRTSLKQTLDKANVPLAFEIAQVELARILLHIARMQFADAMDAARKKFGFNYDSYFTEFDVTGVCAAWEKVCNITHKHSGKKFKVDLNTKETDTFVQQISKKFMQGEYINDCLAQARVTNADFCNEIIIKK